MKIICTKAEKEHIIAMGCVANECYFPFKCIDNCKKCLEEKIEWEIMCMEDQKMADIENTIDGLERLRFFNQRAGRELWGDKPHDVQEEDIASADAVYADAIELLKEKRPTGQWDYGTQCSVCKGTIIPPKDRSVRINFCPWCGADMRGGYDE